MDIISLLMTKTVGMNVLPIVETIGKSGKIIKL